MKVTDSSHLSYAGAEYHFLRRFDTDCHVHVLDLDLVKMKIVHGFSSVPKRAIEMGAQMAHNANGWGLWASNPSLSNEYLVIEGYPIQTKAIDSRPCMNVTVDGRIEFWTRYPISPHNVIGFDRLIAVDGVYNSKITNTTPDPRTVYGKDASGCLVVMVCDGRMEGQKGLTFAECWSVMQEFGVTDCGNADGGYSSCFYNQHFGGLLNRSYEAEFRRTVCQVLFFANELGELPNQPPTEGENMNYQMTVISTPTRLRKDHTTYASNIRDFAANNVLSGTEVWVAPADGAEVKAGDKWLKVTHLNGVAVPVSGWTAYTHKGQPICTNWKEIPVTPPAPDETSVVKIEITFNGNDVEAVQVGDRIFK